MADASTTARSPRPPYLLLEAWNPHVALPFFVLVLLQAWSVATGDDARLPGFVLAGSFAACRGQA